MQRGVGSEKREIFVHLKKPGKGIGRKENQDHPKYKRSDRSYQVHQLGVSFTPALTSPVLASIFELRSEAD